MKYLLDEHQKALAEFINGQLWSEVKACLRDRMPPKPSVEDPTHIAAAKGHQRTACDDLIEKMERLPFEHDETPKSPFAGPLFDTAD